jgi:phosphopentomutase
LRLPFMEGLGLGRATPIAGLRADLPARGAFGKKGSLTKGKDTTAGHWEIRRVFAAPGAAHLS